MCTWTYVAAELDAATSGRAIDTEPALANGLLGDPWRAVVAALQRLPAAHAPAEISVLKGLSVEVRRCIAAWLEHVGFALEDRPGGRLYFGVLNPEDWVT